MVFAHVMPAMNFFLYKNEKLSGGKIWVHKRNEKIIFLQLPKLSKLFYDGHIVGVVNKMKMGTFKIALAVLKKFKKNL